MKFDDPETLLLGLRAGLLLLAFLGFAWALMSSRRDSSLNFMRLSAQHDLALAEIQKLGEKLQQLGAQVHDLSLPSPMVSRPVAAPEPPPPPAAPPTGARGYEMAIRMARGGASVEEIVSGCGTTRAEARLLRRLHYAEGATAA